MTAQKGSSVLIKIGDGAVPTENFATIGGLKITRMVLENQLIDASSVGSGSWRQLSASAGGSLSVSGSGMFTDAASEESVRDCAFSGAARNYRLYFGNGDYVSGAFVISHYERSGKYDEEEIYALTLESAGNIAFTAA